jgi:hypothetical protein
MTDARPPVGVSVRKPLATSQAYVSSAAERSGVGEAPVTIATLRQLERSTRRNAAMAIGSFLLLIAALATAYWWAKGAELRADRAELALSQALADNEGLREAMANGSMPVEPGRSDATDVDDPVGQDSPASESDAADQSPIGEVGTSAVTNSIGTGNSTAAEDSEEQKESNQTVAAVRIGYCRGGGREMALLASKVAAAMPPTDYKATVTRIPDTASSTNELIYHPNDATRAAVLAALLSRHLRAPKLIPNPTVPRRQIEIRLCDRGAADSG